MTDATVILSDDGQGADQVRKRAETAYEQYLAGNDAAFDNFERYLTPVANRIAGKFFEDDLERDDAVQDALMIIVRQQRRERRGIWNRDDPNHRDLETWFKQVVRNTCVSILRKKLPLQQELNLSEDASQEEIVQTLREQFRWTGSDESLLKDLEYFRINQAYGKKNKEYSKLTRVTLKHVKLPVYDTTRDRLKGPVGWAGDTDANPGEDKGADSDPVANAMREENARHVNAGIQQLNDNERQVITMHVFGHMKQTDIAKELGMSNAWVTKVKKSALNRLSELLSDVDPSAGDT